ncbi:Cro/CI family transcriptional regulator [Pseudomonas aeruginosa]
MDKPWRPGYAPHSSQRIFCPEGPDQGRCAAGTGPRGALNKALRVGRDIYVTENADGTYSAEEVKAFPISFAQGRCLTPTNLPAGRPAMTEFMQILIFGGLVGDGLLPGRHVVEEELQ